jgi:hypothetical protein
LALARFLCIATFFLLQFAAEAQEPPVFDIVNSRWGME